MTNSNKDTAAERLGAAKRVVVKIGSALVIGDDGAPARSWLAGLAADIVDLRARGVEVLIVSSGAVALGRRRLGLSGKLRLDEKQAAAAAGQALLVNAWQAAFDTHEVVAAQLLLTLDDTENRRRYLNARATLGALLGQGAVPVINENDTVATAEIRYGDNDRLAAHAAQMAGADLLVLLSDIDGLYTADPRASKTAEHIPHIVCVTPEIEAMAGGANVHTSMGSGGMASKLAAVKIAATAGAATIIARGDIDRPLSALTSGAKASIFAPAASPAKARALWISGRLKPAGKLIIDAGAAAALRKGASLLPAGVTRIEGGFKTGDAVSIEDAEGHIIAKGVIAFDAGDAARIIGKSSEKIEAALGYRRRPELVHRDNLVLND